MPENDCSSAICSPGGPAEELRCDADVRRAGQYSGVEPRRCSNDEFSRGAPRVIRAIRQNKGYVVMTTCRIYVERGRRGTCRAVSEVPRVREWRHSSDGFHAEVSG